MVMKFLKVVWCAVFFALVAAPLLYFFDVKETWVKIAGWESAANMPKFTLKSFVDRSFQNAFTERYSKQFFPRATFLKSAYQLREYTNFGLFHYGYGNSVLEGRDGILFERPYAEFHLTCPRPGGRERYAEVMKVVTDMNDFCRTNGVLFALVTMPDKLQCYPEYLPRWFDWFFDYSNYDTQGELAQIFEDAGVPAFDANKYLMDRKPRWEHAVYPPAGTHFTAYGIGLVYQGFIERFVDTGMVKIKTNRFVGVKKRDKTWRDEDDIGNLMNVWKNPHVENNPHFEPVFEQTNVVLNDGGYIAIGDCYRCTVGWFFDDAGLFDWRKRVIWEPWSSYQKPEAYAKVADDLKMVLLCYQSFNTGRLDKRTDEFAKTFAAIKQAVLAAKKKEKKS